MKTICNCHGVSASCSLKTCWKAVSPFRQVGNLLMEKYDYATLVKTSNRNRGGTKVRAHRRNPKRDLIFFENSPSYCEPINALGIAGTRGRVCKVDSLDSDSCQTLCCGRGYAEVNMTTVSKCHCHYNWCCFVFCDKCYQTGMHHVCK